MYCKAFVSYFIVRGKTMSKKDKKKKHRTKRQRFRRAFFLSMFIFTILGFGIIYGYGVLNKLNYVDISKDDDELGIDKQHDQYDDIMNFVLFGVDNRTEGEKGRSDSIMIATLDKKHKKIKLTSLMRDTYIDIPGRGMDKLNHAYAFGGPELAIKTINQNFNMNIREFATVDFFGLEKIIDTMGGVEINVKPNEVRFINWGVRQMDKLDGKSSKMVSQGGAQTLTGRQAVSYARIRKTGNGDYERTERQRVVLEKVLNKGLNTSVTQYPKLLNTMLPYVDTSLTKSEILSLGTFAITSGIKKIDQYRIPADEHVDNQMINGVSYVVPITLEDNVNLLHNFIYKDIKGHESVSEDTKMQ